ncbi:serine/threonine-protein kinase [Bacillus cereus group sp. MYBKT14-1]|uniref:serine/threonine-protein kinase n=1 Tax=unclassified Bacillus cereus group TaxID=2750818 RepID=UPI003F7ABCBB
MFNTIISERVYDGEREAYRVLKELGHGGFGQVFQIQNEKDGSFWALKTLNSNASSEEYMKGFKNESEMALKVSHKNAIRYKYIHDGSVYQELPPYIIMELAEKGSLQDLVNQCIQSKEFFTVEHLHAMFNQLIDGMEHINNHLIHRDIKPDNILIKEGKLIITDFGLAKIVDATTRNRQQTFKGYGTFEYLSPEAWRTDKNTIQMDIYAMGMTFYKMATLNNAFNLPENASMEEWAQKHLYVSPIHPHIVNSSLTMGISQVIMKMIEKSTKRRYKTWEEIRDDLSKDNLPKSNHDEQINQMIKIAMEKTQIRSSEAQAAEKEKQEKLEKENLIHSQFENEIYTPIKEFVNRFNEKYIDGEIKVSEIKNHRTRLGAYLYYSTDSMIEIYIELLSDSDFIRNVPSDFGRGSVKKVVRPVLPIGNKKILAWGHIKNKNKIGYNLLLVESEDDLYGEWVLLFNRPSGAGSSEHNRPHQFVFELSELEREVHLVNALHVYQTDVLPYEDVYIQTFIQNNI